MNFDKSRLTTLAMGQNGAGNAFFNALRMFCSRSAEHSANCFSCLEPRTQLRDPKGFTKGGENFV
jgi:hypothetical protein